MDNIERCLSDGYSTAGTPGTGLGAVRRLATEFDIHSVPGEGTIVMARFGAATGTATRRDQYRVRRRNRVRRCLVPASRIRRASPSSSSTASATARLRPRRRAPLSMHFT